MAKRHVIEQYYSIRVKTDAEQDLYIAGFDGNVEHLAELINKTTDKKWQKIRIYKYTQNIDLQKNKGSHIVSKKRSCLKINKIGVDSLCTKVDENLMRDGKIPNNILSFFGANETNGR